jgi:O-methyltransferase domain/Dimerisation domain
MASTETIPVSRPEAPPAQQLMQLASGFAFTAAIYPIAKLKIADLLAHGPLPVTEIAQRTRSNADALYRVLRLLSSVGVFAESPRKVFALTPVSEFLRADAPGSMRDTVLWLGNRFHFKVWSEMSHSVATGKPAVEHVYGQPCFDVIFGDPEIAFDFNTAMTCFSQRIAPALLEAYDFSGIDTLMDVAGGHGAILCEVLSHYPEMKGVLFDVPNVIEEATGHISALKMDHRCETVKGGSSS